MKSMLLSISNRNIFPSQVLKLFQALDAAAFFEQSMLIGSWVMPLYQEAFGIPYALRTLDIDFAVKFAATDKVRGADLEKIWAIFPSRCNQAYVNSRMKISA